MIIGFNQTHPDKAKRALFATKDFRIGLSYAINRQKIIDTFYGGQGRPWQCAPLPGNELFDEELGSQYTEYDIDKANEALDRAGLTRRGGDGIRRTADGAPVAFNVLVVSDMPDHVDALDLIRTDWKKVGVDANVQRVAETLYWERVEAGASEAATWAGGPFDLRTGRAGTTTTCPPTPVVPLATAAPGPGGTPATGRTAKSRPPRSKSSWISSTRCGSPSIRIGRSPLPGGSWPSPRNSSTTSASPPRPPNTASSRRTSTTCPRSSAGP
ncbi:ABC transporter substrate-binding protein [Streptomyces sp. FXJ1.4098]|nr:ABC transporter substrate-binding protein [Streptomyces sp. FXJ1.4098]